jgi:hypothetical protein
VPFDREREAEAMSMKDSRALDATPFVAQPPVKPGDS